MPSADHIAKSNAGREKTRQRYIAERGQCRAINQKGQRCKHPVARRSEDGFCGAHLWYGANHGVAS